MISSQSKLHSRWEIFNVTQQLKFTIALFHTDSTSRSTFSYYNRKIEPFDPSLPSWYFRKFMFVDPISQLSATFLSISGMKFYQSLRGVQKSHLDGHSVKLFPTRIISSFPYYSSRKSDTWHTDRYKSRVLTQQPEWRTFPISVGRYDCTDEYADISRERTCYFPSLVSTGRPNGL